MNEHTFRLGQKVITTKEHTWRVNGRNYRIESGTRATVVDFGKYSNDPRIQFKDGVKVTISPKFLKPMIKEVAFSQNFDVTQREVVVEIAQKIYGAMGTDIRDFPLTYLFDSQTPQEIAILKAAEDIFEMFCGNRPTYDDEDPQT